MVDGIEEYLAYLNCVTGLGPKAARPAWLSAKDARSAVSAHALAMSEHNRVALRAPETSGVSEMGKTTPTPSVDAKSPRSPCVHEETKGASVAQKPRRSNSKLGATDTSPPVQESAEEPKRALTINEAARLYSISRSSLYILIRAGTLPDLSVAGRRLLPRDAMEALIAGKRP